MSLSGQVASLATRVATEIKGLKGKHPTVVKQSGASYPTRPTGTIQVIWIGTADPGTAALDGDLWVTV